MLNTSFVIELGYFCFGKVNYTGYA